LQNNSENFSIREKSPEESSADVIIRMFPSDVNPDGNVFGGEILKHIDMVADIITQRHSQSNAVTISMDSVNFIKHGFVGNVLKLNARINYVHNSSMEIEVRAEAEDIVTGIKTITGTAFVTFVTLDKNGKPAYAPKLLLKTDEDRTKFAEGKIRMEERLKHRKNLISDFYGTV